MYHLLCSEGQYNICFDRLLTSKLPSTFVKHLFARQISTLILTNFHPHVLNVPDFPFKHGQRSNSKIQNVTLYSSAVTFKSDQGTDISAKHKSLSHAKPKAYQQSTQSRLKQLHKSALSGNLAQKNGHTIYAPRPGSLPDEK